MPCDTLHVFEHLNEKLYIEFIRRLKFLALYKILFQKSIQIPPAPISLQKKKKSIHFKETCAGYTQKLIGQYFLDFEEIILVKKV